MAHRSSLSPIWRTLLLGVALGCCVPAALGQSLAPAGELRIAVREDDRSVQIYHTASVPIEHGFVLYRRDTETGEFLRLNEQPVRSVRSGAELRDFLGTLYGPIEEATGQDNANSTLARVRSDTRVANLLTFLYPEAADALGRRYVDRSAPIESVVTYRMAFVDARNEPTGLVLEQTLLLLPGRPEAPIGLRAVNQGRRLTLYWRFVPPSRQTDDRVVRFEAFRIDPNTNQPARVHPHVILRNNAVFEYAVTFDVPTTGQTERLFVQGVDFTGQTGIPSEELRFDVVDTRAPNMPMEVRATAQAGGPVQITWRAAPETDVIGYHVYRSGQVFNEAGYERLSEVPVPVGETSFQDTLVSNKNSRLFYRVAALDGAGNEGMLSNPALVLVENSVPPEAPADLQVALDTTGAVLLTWSPPPSGAARYAVYRSRQGDPLEAAIRIDAGRLRDTTLVDAGEPGNRLVEGGMYHYRVIAEDHAGTVSAPAIATLRLPDITAPAPPAGLLAIAHEVQHLRLAWNPSPAEDLWGYVVYSQRRGETRVDHRIVPAQHDRLDLEGLDAGATYTFWITAADSAGNESPRTEPITITPGDTSPPRAVRNVRARIDEAEGLVLTWEPVVAFDLAGYRVYRGASATGPFEALQEEVVTNTTWRDPDGSAGLWYRVLAVDTSGNESLSSAPAGVTLPRQP